MHDEKHTDFQGTDLPGNGLPIRGRGADSNPPNRFEPLVYEPDPEGIDPEAPPLRTQFFRDSSRSLITFNDSPDVGFDASLNPYRGCEHGCVYCYARPTHEYLGLSAGLDFETKIIVKEDAPQLLRRELASPRWRPQVLALSGVTDPYQPVERHLKLTRRLIAVLAEFRNPVAIITKNHRVTRDRDLLEYLAKYEACSVSLSITTLRGELQRALEPRTSPPSSRLQAIRELRAAGIPVGVVVAPVIPGLTDHEIPAVVNAAAKAGAQFAGFIVLRLPHGLGELFESWLEHHSPARKSKVLGRVKELRGGRLNDPGFGTRMTGKGPFAEQIASLFGIACQKAGLSAEAPALSASHFRRSARQLTFFDL